MQSQHNNQAMHIQSFIVKMASNSFQVKTGPQVEKNT
jgi:hypothetical protein